jgi:D-glycero-D-manno-heptose 1,7-bisphosphate phosphatase
MDPAGGECLATNRAVFLDRDGVLNTATVRDGKPYPPENIQELQILPGVKDALARLKRSGFLLLVVTNQPDVARGTQSRERVEEMNALLKSELPVDEFRVCYHDDKESCACRKPKPGLLLDAAAEHDIDLGASFMIGDRWRDVDAGAAAGCRTIWIDRAYREKGPTAAPDARVRNLSEAADWIIALGGEK